MHNDELIFEYFRESSKLRIATEDGEIYLTVWEFDHFIDHWNALIRSSRLNRATYVYNREQLIKEDNVSE